ncbi:hypothetical protein Peur_008502 [Populus x canadensis]
MQPYQAFIYCCYELGLFFSKCSYKHTGFYLEAYIIQIAVDAQAECFFTCLDRSKSFYLGQFLLLFDVGPKFFYEEGHVYTSQIVIEESELYLGSDYDA